MKKRELLKELEKICKNAGYIVKYVNFTGLSGTGDHCRLYEDKYIVVNGLLKDDEKIESLISIMKKVDIRWSDYYTLPEVKEFLIKKGVWVEDE